MAITRSRNLILIGLAVATIAGAIGLPGAQNVAGAGPLGLTGPQTSAALHAEANHVISQLPLLFEPNAGRAGASADFVARGNGFAASLDARRLAVATPRANLHMRLAGANPAAAAVPGNAVQGTTNSYVGSGASSWASDLPSYERVGYDNVYPGVDLSYVGDHGRLEYAFKVSPGARSRTIALTFPGTTSLHKGKAGGLVLRVPHSKERLRWRRPAAYQQAAGSARTVVPVRFDLRGPGRAGFTVGPHNPAEPLVIDPTIAYSTYLGGSNQETGRAIDITPAGDMVAVGSTTSVDFPTLNAAQGAYSGFEQDLVIVRINAAGSLVYSTYLGGNGDDNPRDVTFDPSGNAWVTGFGNSNDFPTLNPLQAKNAGGGNDWYLSELSPTGSLLYSTYIGGKGKDGKPHIALGTDGSIYLAGYSSGAFPTTPGAFQPVAHGDVDDLFVKLAPGGQSIVYATYFGGAGNDTSRGVEVDSSGDLYSAGWTESSDFPVTAGASQSTFGGMRDATMLKLDPSGQPVYSTYLGGSDVDGPYPGDSVAIDSAGNAYVTGWVTSSNFPTVNPIQATIGSLTLHDVFVAKFSPSGSLLFSTYFGGTTVDEGAAIGLDAAGNIYVTGTTSSQNWPVLNSMQPTKPGSGDGFLLKISPTYQLVFSTWLGGSGVDTPSALAVDPAGDAYVSGFTTSNNFPTVNPIQASNAGKQDMFVTEIMPGTSGSPSPTPSPSTSPTSSPSPSPSPTSSPTSSPSPSPSASPSSSPTSSPSPSPTSSPSPGTKPNFVVVLTDDQRWDTVGRCLPAIDPTDYHAGANSCMPFLQQDLMPNGVTFQRGYVTTSLCCPSRASILTGQYQEHTHVVDNNGFSEFDDSSTLPIWLQSAGYKTGLFGKYLNGYGETGQSNYIPPGWDAWHAFFGGVGYKSYPLLERDPGGPTTLTTYDDHATTNNNACATGNFYSTDFLCRKALDFLAANTGSPFLLYFAPLSPHVPSTPPRRYSNTYPNLPQPQYPSYNVAPTPNTPSWIQKSPYSATSLNQIQVGYRNALETNRAADDSIDALYQQIASEGQLSNTVWVFLSDNGVAAGEHRYNDKSCEYEECHKVPFVVVCPPAVCPGATPGTVDSTHPVLNIDIAPTFAALAGVTPTIPVDGRNLAPLLNDPSSPWRTWFHISDAGGKPGTSTGIVSDQPDGHTYKYVSLPAAHQSEMYDLTTDPWELTNLAGDGVHTAVQTLLSGQLANLLASPAITLNGPAAFTNQADASFTWTSSKSATFTCTLDAGTPAPCGSGLSGSLSFPSVATGPHAFTVKAQDSDNNFGSSTDTFTVDRTPPPPAAFTQTPADPSGASVTFAFTDAESGSTFTCSLDGVAASACSSPLTYASLANGPHSLAVLATDAAGNPASNTTTFSWTASVPVDGTPPTVNMSTPKPDEILTKRNVSVAWNGTDNVGIIGYTLAERVGTGGTQSTVYSGLGKSFTRSGALGTTYCYQVTAFDAAANHTTTPERCAAVPMDDRSVSITYLGSAAQETPAAAFESTLSVLDSSGDEADLSFTGRSVGILAEKTSGSGKFQAYIDGSLAKTVDLYSATTKNKTLVFQQAVAPGAHTLRIVWISAKNSASTGNRVGLDGVGVIR